VRPGGVSAGCAWLPHRCEPSNRWRFLALQWSEDHGDELHFLNTKNGQVRRVQVTARLRELLDGLPKGRPHVFANKRTEKPYQNIRKVFERLNRAGIPRCERAEETPLRW
jgi:hypothetical protein